MFSRVGICLNWSILLEKNLDYILESEISMAFFTTAKEVMFSAVSRGWLFGLSAALHKS